MYVIKVHQQYMVEVASYPEVIYYLKIVNYKYDFIFDK